MKETIVDLCQFQIQYLKKLIENIPEDRLYEKQLEGYNSAGWILGHICVEAEDVFAHLDIQYPTVDENWISWFRNSSGKITSLENLPSKEELIQMLESRYHLLCDAYLNLSDERRNGPHPSNFMKDKLKTFDSWYAHLLTTHISIHCGNLSIWKKIIGLPIGGY